MPNTSISKAFASPSPAAPPASDWRSSELSSRAARASPSSPASAERVERVAARRAPRHRRRRRTQGGHLSDRAADRRATSAASTCSSTTPRASARCRSRCSPTPNARIFEQALAVNLLGPVPPDQGAARRARRVGARGARRRRGQHLERRRGQRLSRLGRLRREQGGAPPLTAIWAEEAKAEGVRSCRSIPATWTRRCTRWPCRTPIRRR